MKQVIKREHKTPNHDPDELKEDMINTLLIHYGNTLGICGYCGWYRHKNYVCSCGVDEGYLADENGATVRPFVPVFEVPDYYKEIS